MYEKTNKNEEKANEEEVSASATFEEVLTQHRQLQDRYTEEMVTYATHLKQNATTLQQIISNDIQVHFFIIRHLHSNVIICNVHPHSSPSNSLSLSLSTTTNKQTQTIVLITNNKK
jgi:hypothetical protein